MMKRKPASITPKALPKKPATPMPAVKSKPMMKPGGGGMAKGC